MALLFRNILLFTLFGSSVAQSCDGLEDFVIRYDTSVAMTVSQRNLTTTCPAGFSAGSSKVDGGLRAGSASVAGALGSASIGAPLVAIAGAVTTPTVAASDTVAAQSLVGSAAQLTNLAAQPEFSAASNTATALTAANVRKNCTGGSAISRINPNGTFACVPLPFMNGVIEAACLTTADCVSGLVCDQTTRRCAAPSGYACTSDAQCQTGLACTLNGQCSIPPTSCTAIKAAYPPAASGVYLLSVPRKGAVYFYCNMVSAGSFGWTLAWSNVRGGTGKPATQMTLEPAINVRPTCSWFSIAQHSPVRTIKT
eukprot:TRINITY_DN2347_c0_g1_i1.p2 TRINITY_DN2347_c0_g1~~TRINITY_DN2347_c0_g1_i1.p2  ORF type:complete len:311 (+),score=77.63 TRINITY_DN2347_c0_g1_i1:99-1031(+)